MISKATIRAVKAHAEQEYPKEACGLIVQDAEGRDEYWPLLNRADRPEEYFVIAAEDLIRAEEAGRVLAVVHSHPEGPDAATDADRAFCNQEDVPWYIVAVYKDDEGVPKAGNVFGIAPTGKTIPLMGRPFVHGVLDCYAIIRDWFGRCRGVELPNHKRDDLWWEKGQNLYMDNLAADGWRVLAEDEPLQTGDMILMQIGADVANHAALYLGVEQLDEGPALHPMSEAMIHHLYGRPSERTMYGGMYKHCTVAIARHQSLEK